MLEYLLLMKQELMLSALIFLLLIIFLASNNLVAETLIKWINVLLLVNFLLGFWGNSSGSLFGNMYHTNALIVFQKNLLNFALLVISLLSYDWLKTHRHYLEFYILMLAALLGAFYLISSRHLLMFFLGLELAGIPVALLANFDLGKKRSSEAALKYIMSSAFASAMFLFGSGFIYALTGTLDFFELHQLASGSPVFLFAFIFVLAGIGFKISAVPFHLWTADVYEGAPVAATSYLSVISKGSVMFILAYLLFYVFENIIGTWRAVIILIALFSITLGNLFALRQQNIKRFMAFSSITQMGFVLIALAAAKLMSTSALIYFIMIYIFSNLAAFGIIAVVYNQTGSEAVNDFKGFYKKNPALAWVFALALFSLAGIPPMAGFFGKFFLVLAVAGSVNYVILTLVALNIVLSVYYYLRIVKLMFMDAEENDREIIFVSPLPKIALWVCTAGTIVTGVMSGAYEYIAALVKSVW